MLRDVHSKNPSVTAQEVEAFAQYRGFDLPDAYREFLVRYNGGRPKPATFPIEGLPLNPDGSIQVFFGLHAAIPTSDLENVIYDLAKSVPAGLLPIACTDGYDFICIDFRKSGTPVVYWDRREFWGNEVWKERYLYPIAANFDAFLESLHDAT